MAKGPKHEPEVTDLARYRKAKAEAARQAKANPKPARPGRPGGGEGFLGSNPRAGLILGVVAVVLVLLWLGPMFLW